MFDRHRTITTEKTADPGPPPAVRAAAASTLDKIAPEGRQASKAARAAAALGRVDELRRSIDALTPGDDHASPIDPLLEDLRVVILSKRNDGVSDRKIAKDIATKIGFGVDTVRRRMVHLFGEPKKPRKRNSRKPRAHSQVV